MRVLLVLALVLAFVAAVAAGEDYSKRPNYVKHVCQTSSGSKAATEHCSRPHCAPADACLLCVSCVSVCPEACGDSAFDVECMEDQTQPRVRFGRSVTQTH